MKNRRVIGILGGVGPFAGLELARRVMKATSSTRDQDHLPLVLASFPGEIPDRSEFLRTGAGPNPGEGAVKSLERLAAAGAEVIGVACNTIHAPACWEPIADAAKRLGLTLLHAVEETCRIVSCNPDWHEGAGLLGTSGLAQSGIYSATLKSSGIRPIKLPVGVQDAVQELIYNAEWGLKAAGVATPQAAAQAQLAENVLVAGGARVIILACTELSLLDTTMFQVPVIDSLDALAAALVTASRASTGPTIVANL